MLTSCLIVLLAGTVYAQSGSLQGTVTDASNGETIPGANIFLVEIQRGTATDADGNYSITGLPEREYTIRATFIGYKRFLTTVTVSGETELNIELGEDLVGLEEIVVTGQGGAGVQSRRLSTTVESINAKELEKMPAQNLSQILQANLASSQIRTSSGQPGTASLIRGRGVNSALTSTTPVIYVDGVRVDNTTGPSLGIATGGAQSSSINDIPIENIERIEVVKGGAATTLYGSDAANGVIQIFTKSGVRGATRFNFESKIGAIIPTKDFLKYDQTADLIFRNGLTQDYVLSGSGGREGLTFSFSGSLSDNDGFRTKEVNNQVRHNLRATVGADLNDVVAYRGSLGFTSNEFGRDNNANSSFGLFSGLESTRYGALDELDDSGLSALKDQMNTIAENIDFKEDTKRFQTSHELNFDLMEGWSAGVTVGLDNIATRQREIQTNAYLIALGFAAPGTSDQGTIQLFERDFLGVTIEANTQFQKEFGDFSSVSVFGGQLFRTDDRQLNAVASEVPDGIKTLNSAADVSTVDFRRTLANYGVFVQENLGFKDRYFIEFGIRGDGNTAFGEETGIQYYPKVGASYVISDEPFFRKTISASIISNFKIRANYGFAGNFPTPFSNVVLADIDPFLGQQSLEFGTPGDIELKPEKSETIEIGADLAFINDRAIVEFTYFNTLTKDALFNSRFASSTGFLSALQNVGEIENKGWELSTRFRILQKRDYGLRFNASINTLENTVIKSGGAPFNVGGFTFLGNFVEEGFPVGYFRGNQPVFSDDGSLVEVIPNANLGNSLPEYYGTLGLSANYKDLSLTITSDYQIGAEAVNTSEVLRFLRGDPDDNLYPDGAAGQNFFDLAGLWVQNADYLKVRLISIDYNLPASLYEGIVRQISVGASVTNPFNFVKSDFDPEVSGAALGGQGGGSEVGVGGFVYGTASSPRTFLGKVRITF